MDKNNIPISNNKFEIIRYEGFGYVTNICNYDKNIFNLEVKYIPSELEGGNCKVIYTFTIIEKDNFTKSTIEYIEDYHNNKYYTFYEYDSNDSNTTIKKLKSKQKYKSMEKNKTKCIII